MLVPTDAFTVSRRIRFSETDPAGMVFYSEYFRMFNDLFEDWLVDYLDIAFADEFAKEERMFPLVHTEVDFKVARVMGQNLNLTLVLTALGRSSICYTIVGHDAGEECLRGSFVTCFASKKTKTSVALPDDMRGKMEAYLALCREGMD